MGDQMDAALEGLYEVTLNYGGYDYVIRVVEKEEAERLKYDPVYARQYSRMVVDQFGRAALGLPSDDVMPLTPESPAGTCPQESPTTRVASGNEFKWTHQLILLLIETRSSMTDQFNSARRKKRLWEKVADVMRETSGIHGEGDKCDEKWRNLVTSYRRIKDKLSDTGESNVTWEYFHVLDAILQNKPCSAPPPERLRSLLASVESGIVEDASVASTSEGAENSLSSFDNPRDQSASTTPSKTPTPSTSSTESDGGSSKKKAPIWFRKYLEQREEERRQDIERHQASREEKRRRWEEQKELDKEKIRTFTNLNDILTRVLLSQTQQTNPDNQPQPF